MEKTVSKSLRMDDWNVYLFLFVGCVYQERGFAIDYVDENSQRTTLYLMGLMGYLIYYLHAGCCSSTVSPKI